MLPLEHQFERYRPYLKMVARLQIDGPLQGKIDPSDIVQQTLIEAFQGQTQFRGSTNAELSAWLRQILARNLADEIRRLGRQKRNIALEKSLHEQLNETTLVLERWLASNDSSPSECAMHSERLLQLAAALADLPTDQRRAIELYHLQGKTAAEVAQALERTEVAVAGLLRRGLQKLRAHLRTMERD
jgi:RNA polymerase sigma-70 factor (ECF subfamily)